MAAKRPTSPSRGAKPRRKAAASRPRRRPPEALQDFVDVVSALNGMRARFLVVGAYAMAAHGVPRATGDLDVWVDPDVEIDGVTFDEAWAGRLEGTLGSVRLAYIGREALIRNKKAAGRAKDLADLEALRGRQP